MGGRDASLAQQAHATKEAGKDAKAEAEGVVDQAKGAAKKALGEMK